MSLGWLDQSRAKTLAFVESLSDDALRAWPDPELSPICWHLGHVAFTEALWIHEHCNHDDALSAPYRTRYAQDGCAKHERAEGFERDALFEYLQRVRDATHRRYASVDHPMKAHDYLAWFIAAHEDQHRETMRIVHALAQPHTSTIEPDDALPTILDVPGGAFRVGTDSPRAYDNERPALDARVEPFRIDAHPTTCGAWLAYMREQGAPAPRGAMRHPRHPVMGISWHEADAYARFRGGRLPTELEWEYLARRSLETPHLDAPHLDAEAPREVRDGEVPTDLIGNVWEWTADWFEARDGFVPYPYDGYSTPWFRATHRVMRGGSFATSPRIATPSFRNWYTPRSRQLFVGVRVAYDG